MKSQRPETVLRLLLRWMAKLQQTCRGTAPALLLSQSSIFKSGQEGLKGDEGSSLVIAYRFSLDKCYHLLLLGSKNETTPSTLACCNQSHCWRTAADSSSHTHPNAALDPQPSRPPHLSPYLQAPLLSLPASCILSP